MMRIMEPHQNDTHRMRILALYFGINVSFGRECMRQPCKDNRKKDPKEKKRMSITLKTQEYERLTLEAENARLPVATYCAKLLEDGEYTINLRSPAEMDLLREILSCVSGIQKDDREVLRQLRITGKATDSLEKALNRKTGKLEQLVRKLEN